MSIFDKLKAGAGHRSESADELPVLGRQEPDAFPEGSARRSDAQPDLGQDYYEERLNQELPSVNRRRGNNKLINTLGFILIVGGGMALLYAVNSGGGKRESTQKLAANKQISNVLPPLTMPDPPAPVAPSPIPLQPGAGTVNVPAIQGGAQPIPLQVADKNGPAKDTAGKEPPSWEDRKLEGEMLVGKPTGIANRGSAGAAAGEDGKPEVATVPGELAELLKPTVTKAVSANLLPDRNYLIAKGTSLDCALETAIDSSVPGITTCRLTRDVYSDNGHVVLLDRGSQLVGEYKGGIKRGQARIFVLWTRAKTPNGVVVALDSPGADALGRGGHSGWVDTHFMERFGAAIMMSLVKDAFAYARASVAEGGGVSVGGGDTDKLSTEILKNTINIPPTLYINQGDHIQVMVARDLDFASVYRLDLKQ